MNRKKLGIAYIVSLSIAILIALVDAFLVWNSNQELFGDLPKSYQVATLLGYILFGIIGLIFIGTILSLMVRRRRNQHSPIIDKVEEKIKEPGYKYAVITIFILGALAAGQFLLQIPGTEKEFAKALLIYNQPLLLFLILFCTVSLGFFLVWTDEIRKVYQKEVYIPILISIILLFSLLVLDRSGYGFQNRNQGGGNFRLTGFPVLDYQIRHNLDHNCNRPVDQLLVREDMAQGIKRSLLSWWIF